MRPDQAVTGDDPFDGAGAGVLDAPRKRRDILKMAGALAIAGTAAPIVARASSTRPTQALGRLNDQAAALTGPLSVLDSGDVTTVPARQQVWDDFRTANPGVEPSIQALPTGGDWDRLARAAIAAGEPVDLLAINGQFVRAWVRDGLLADLDAEAGLAGALGRVPEPFHLSGPGETTTRAFPLAMTNGIHTTGLYYNKALLDQAGVAAPGTIDDLKSLVEPLAALGAAPLVHNSGDPFFNPLLVMWILPQIASRTGDPIVFAEDTMKGDIRYDSPEWLEAFQIISDLSSSGALMAGSGATDYATMQQLFLSGKAATTYNGTWLLGSLQDATPSADMDLHVTGLPLVSGAAKAMPLMAWVGYALPAQPVNPRDNAIAFIDFVSQPEVDKEIVAGTQVYSPMPSSNEAITDPIAKEFLPYFADVITPLDWLWEPEIATEVGTQVQALVKGDTTPEAVGAALETLAQQLRDTGRSFYS
jgi:ABC-type glycerol-3-phosphate transport system substrate-binding protein